MGLHRMMGNNKHRKPKGYSRLKRRLGKKHKALGICQNPGGISDPELITVHILKKRRSSPRANITLSGKKRRKLLKQIRHQEKVKSEMDVEETSKGQLRVVKGKKTRSSDIEMKSSEDATTNISSGTTSDTPREEDVVMVDET
ncbi:hypothetical protein LSH36_373g02026 [Paralvinella palmiformis]|uniref:Uncharacterized protein n=1 Tax=Paralvinella palmiformis TaxID=53620 RepID=A0AAD9JDJ1_9ANNE|nr:hypothetical protein LSH36_373g02026 [Paralvinella palmiformis]